MDAEHPATTDPATSVADPAGHGNATTHRAPRPAPEGQLRLHVGEPNGRAEWRLDEETRAVGRRGIAQARAALRSARADHLDERRDRPAASGSPSARHSTAA